MSSITIERAEIMDMIKSQVDQSFREMINDGSIQNMVNTAVANCMRSNNENPSGSNQAPPGGSDSAGLPRNLGTAVSIQQQIDSLTRSQQFFNHQYEMLIGRLHTTDHVVHQRLLRNEKQLLFLHNEIDGVQQHGRRETLEFEGLANLIEQQKCSAKEAVVALINKELDMPNVKLEHISTAHGFHKDGKEDNSVVYAKFTNRDIKNDVFAKRKALRKDGQRQRFYINQNLTPYRRNLFAQVKKMQNFKFKWTNKNGDILIKANEHARVIKIRNHEDLHRVQCNAAASRVQNNVAPPAQQFMQHPEMVITNQNNSFSVPDVPQRAFHSQPAARAY